MTHTRYQSRGARHGALCAIAALCTTIIAATTLATSLATTADAQGHAGHTHQPPAPIKEVPLAELMAPGELPEIAIGRPDAPVTIVEYASMTCANCGRVHRDVIPKLKAKYIDTGTARLIVREFPIEKTAMAVSMLARCAGPENTYAVITAMFERQQSWLRSGDIRADLLAILEPFGMTAAQFKSCLENKPLFHQIKALRKRATEAFAVSQTPTFFINGKPLVGPASIDAFDAIIEPLIKR